MLLMICIVSGRAISTAAASLDYLDRYEITLSSLGRLSSNQTALVSQYSAKLCIFLGLKSSTIYT